jgi:hypothetical protein
LAVMSELLRFGCNAAIPEVDLGPMYLHSRKTGRKSSASR